MTLKSRIEALEQSSRFTEPPTSIPVYFCKGKPPSETEQQEIDRLRAEHGDVIVFTQVNARLTNHGINHIDEI